MKKQLLLIAGAFLAAASMNAQTVYLSEDFEGGSMPAGWAANPASNGWAVPCVNSTSFTPPAHTVFAGCNDDAVQSAANGNALLTTPVVNLSAATTVYLKFDAFFQGLTYNNVTEQAEVLYSTDGGSTWTSAGQLAANASWATYAQDMSAQLAGQANVKIAFKYNDGGDWLFGAAIDNVSIFTPAPNDAALTAVTPALNSPAAYGVVSSNITLGGTITNEGTSAITSCVVKYDAGAGVQSYTLSSINIAPFASYNFTHNVPYTIPSAGPHPVSMWVELSGDADHSNDTMATSISGVAFMPTHAVTVEEATGTWCGWCVRGIVYMDSLKEVHGNTANIIAVHNGDPMVVSAYDAGVGTLIGGYPSTLVNRDLVSDPAYAFDDYNNSINDFGYANITPQVDYNTSTRAVTVTANAQFAVDLTGNYRFIVAFTEMGVHNASGGQWDQHNYYSSQSQNIPLVGGGVDYQALPSTIPSAQMYYNFVARNLQGGFTGQAGSLPSTIPAGSTQTYAFPSWTIPAGYNVDSMQVIVMLYNYTTGHIMNSASAPIWGGALSVNEQSSVNVINAYPNPANDNMNVNLNLVQNENVTIEMYSLTGELISSENMGDMSAGDHTVALNTANLADGMYIMTVRAGASVVTTRVTVAH